MKPIDKDRIIKVLGNPTYNRCINITDDLNKDSTIEIYELEPLSKFKNYSSDWKNYQIKNPETPISTPELSNVTINPTPITTINSPVTTGESVSPTLEYDSNPNINYCKDCIYFENGEDIGFCDFHETRLSEDDFCSFFRDSWED